MNIRIACVLLAAFLAGTALADTPVYKWVDPDGNVHYSTVPQTANAQQLNIVNTSSNPAPAPSTSAAPVNTDQALTRVSPDDPPACKSARQDFGKYLNAEYLYTQGKDGKQVKLSKEDHDKIIAQGRDAVAHACPPQESSP